MAEQNRTEEIDDHRYASRRSGFEDDLADALHRLDSFGEGVVHPFTLAVDEHQVRDSFLDLLADSDRLFRDTPLLSTKQQIRSNLRDVYLATFEVDWKLAGPWLLEAAVDLIEELRDTKDAVRPRPGFGES